MKKNLDTIIKNWVNLENFLSNKIKYYTVYYIPKADGKRWRKICTPSEDLKLIQRSILAELSNIVMPEYIHGFVSGKSVKTNAVCHQNKPLVMSLDILNFFGSTTFDMVRKSIPDHMFSCDTMDMITEIATLDNGLPQGSPISPILANLSFLPIDSILSTLAGRNDGVYSRYADDMTISSYDRGSHDIIRYMESIINDHGYMVNAKKTRVFGRGNRQVVTGLVVNEKTQPSSKYKRTIKAKLHNLVRDGATEYCMASIRGECNWIRKFNDNFYDKYLESNLIKLEEMVDGVF